MRTLLFVNNVRQTYFKNFDRTLAEPQNNNLSIKVIYFPDYLNIKKMRSN